MYVPYKTYPNYHTETSLLFLIQYFMIFRRFVQFGGQDLLIIWIWMRILQCTFHRSAQATGLCTQSHAHTYYSNMWHIYDRNSTWGRVILAYWGHHMLYNIRGMEL